VGSSPIVSTALLGRFSCSGRVSNSPLETGTDRDRPLRRDLEKAGRRARRREERLKPGNSAPRFETCSRVGDARVRLQGALGHMEFEHHGLELVDLGVTGVWIAVRLVYGFQALRNELHQEVDLGSVEPDLIGHGIPLPPAPEARRPASHPVRMTVRTLTNSGKGRRSVASETGAFGCVASCRGTTFGACPSRSAWQNVAWELGLRLEMRRKDAASVSHGSAEHAFISEVDLRRHSGGEHLPENPRQL
jgi:hypothetical protein